MSLSARPGLTLPVFFGLEGLALSDQERGFFEDVKPAGFILFARNISTVEQVKALCADLSAYAPGPAPAILIDQEGGRVRRLKPPLVHAHPPARPLGLLYERDPGAALEGAKLHGQLIGAELADLGISVDCLPVLDLLFPETHDIIGDRAFSADPEVVAALGDAVIAGLTDSGVVPVIKHIPGHGRAKADSHLELPVVKASKAELMETDFVPFKMLSNAPMAMTAHILYTALDEMDCATHSAHIIDTIIRGHMGFDGLLMSDDLSMKALGGEMGARALKAIQAGCDIALHCNGDMAEMEAIAKALSPISDTSKQRLEKAMHPALKAPQSVDMDALFAARSSLLEGLA